MPINRVPSPLVAVGVPWFSVALVSLLVSVVTIASVPMVPPLAFLFFIAWKQLRPGLLPVWAGLPLGFVEDLYSGQPFGSAVLLWSIAAIGLDIVEARLPWRNFLTEWLVAAALIAAYIVFGLALANIAGGTTQLMMVFPQIALSILLFPLVGRIVARLDRFRLTPFVELR